MAELALHPTVKPVQMIADAIRDVSGRGEIVLDLFGGSGSTLIAAEKTGRRAFVCELDPVYCDRIIRRWEAYAKDEAEQIVCGYADGAAAAEGRGMRRKSDGRSTALTVLPTPTSYEVGYRKPPVHSQFQKGRSGNPKGRPKGAKAKTYPAHAERLKAIVLEEAYRMIGVRDGLREMKVPMAQAIVRALAVNAVKGQQRAQRLFTELLTPRSGEAAASSGEVLDRA